MSVLRTVYARLPPTIQPIVRDVYYEVSGEPSPTQIETEFVNRFFDSEDEYRAYQAEFKESTATEARSDALKQYRQLTPNESLSDIGLEVGARIYSLLRKKAPETVVETGVCNGFSTLCILLALRENGTGELISIDFPFYADESLEEFRQETFDEYGGAAIPADKDPGWIIPDSLRNRWELKIGKSQRLLPQVAVEKGEIDCFMHDSEHSLPCMMFEYELMWERLADDGIILSDDIHWNDAYDIFANERNAETRLITKGVGSLIKQS